MLSLNATCVHVYVDTRKVSVTKCTPPLAQMRHPALVSVPMLLNRHHQNYESDRGVATFPFKECARVLRELRGDVFAQLDYTQTTSVGERNTLPIFGT